MESGQVGINKVSQIKELTLTSEGSLLYYGNPVTNTSNYII